MKAFEKWWEENHAVVNKEAMMYADIEEGWRAALEWAMTLANCGGEIAHHELQGELQE